MSLWKSILNIEDCAFEEYSPIGERTTFKIGPVARVAAYPKTVKAMARLIAALSEADLPFTVLGCGSNVLFRGESYDGAVIFTKELDGCEIKGENELYFEAGVRLTAAAKFALKAGLSGLEFAYGIPGGIGGGIFMNAGAYGGQMANAVYSVTACNRMGKTVTLTSSELEFGYRKSVFQKGELFVLSAVLRLEKGDKSVIKATMDSYMASRTEKQPLDVPSAGSTFKRGNGFITAQIIDQCGLKGLRVGGACVSKKHAGFIVNDGGASAEEVLELVEKVKAEVFEKTGKTIECEIRIIGQR